MNKKILLFLLTFLTVLYLIPSALAADEAHNCNMSEEDYCIVCDVAQKINALPAADDITVNNAAVVTDKIHAIDRIKGELTDEQYEELLTLVDCGNDGSGYGTDVPVRYMEALEKIRELGGNSLYVAKKFIAADGSAVNIDNAEITVKVTNVDTDETFTLTLATAYNTLGTLCGDASFYTENESGWTYRYTMPAGTFRIEEVSYSGATVNGREFVTAEVLYNEVAGTSTTVTFADGAADNINVGMTNVYQPEHLVNAKDENGNALSGVSMSIVGVTEPDFTYSWTTDGYETALYLMGNREYTISVDAVPAGYEMPSPASVTFTVGDGSNFTGAFEAEISPYFSSINVTIPKKQAGPSVILNFVGRDGNPLAVDGDYSYGSEHSDYTGVDSFTNLTSYTIENAVDGWYDITFTNAYEGGYDLGGSIEFKVTDGKIEEINDEENGIYSPSSNNHTLIEWSDNSVTFEVSSIVYSFSTNVMGIDAALPFTVMDAYGNEVITESSENYEVYLAPGEYKMYAPVDEDFATIINFPAEDEYLSFTVNEDYTLTINSDHNTIIDDFNGSYWLTWYLDAKDTVEVTAIIKTSDNSNFPEGTTITLCVESGVDEESGETWYSELQSISVPTDVSEFTYTWTVASYHTKYGEDGEIDLIENTYLVKGMDADWNEIYFNETEANLFEGMLEIKNEITVEFSSITDAGYFAETEESEGKVGVIALNAQITNIDEISAHVVKFGMLLYKNGFSDVPEIDDGSSNVEQLYADGGYYHSIIKNISEEEFDTVFYAIPFAVIDTDGDFETTEDQSVYIGDVIYASVSEYNAWLGNVNPY